MNTKLLDIAKQYNNILKQYDKYPAATNRSAYEGLADGLKDEILREGERFLGFRFRALAATEYMNFVRTGNRADFEAVYFEKRHALCALTLAECVEYKGRFVDDIVNGVFSICEESGWQLPAHNTYVRDTPQHPLPDLCKPIIDLFAAETGVLLAWVFYLLDEKLDTLSPVIRKRIKHELALRIFTPYTQSHFWWMGNGDEKMCNWTAWCTQNILLTAFLVLGTDDNQKEYKYDKKANVNKNSIDDIDNKNCKNDSDNKNEQIILKEVFIQAAESCDCFLKDYGEDGCCDEGAQYYRHAGLCLYGALDVLNYVSDNAFSALFKEPKIKNIASYIVNVHASDEYYFNFADCASKPGRCGVREYLFGKATDEQGLCQLAASDFSKENGRLYSGATDQINLYYLLMTCFNYEEVMHFSQNNASTNIIINNIDDINVNNVINNINNIINTSNEYNHLYKSDIYYKSVGIFIARNDVFSIAVKAGNNDDNHNHNDTGSFIIYKNGMPVFVDIGVESYTQKTFSDRRYEIWTMQSCYHNLPTINGKDEEAGAHYQASNVEYTFNENDAQISMELSTAYPIEQCSYMRTITFDKKNNCITITDTTDCTDATLNFILATKPAITANTFTLGTNAAGTQTPDTPTFCTFTGADFLNLETLKITDPRLKQSWSHDLYRLQLKLKESPAQTERSFQLKIT